MNEGRNAKDASYVREHKAPLDRDTIPRRVLNLARIANETSEDISVENDTISRPTILRPTLNALQLQLAIDVPPTNLAQVMLFPRVS